jgi:hypothetical protein
VKIGSENRNKVIAAGVLLVLALFSVGRMLFSSPDRPPVSAVQAAANAPATRPATAAKRVAAKGQAKAGNESLDPRLQLKLLEASEAVKYEGKGRNIFLAQAEVIPQPKAQVAVRPQPVMPPPPPQPPPIDLRFFGFASRPGEPKRVFLKQGEDTFIAGEGDIVDRRYRIIRIGPTFVEVEDVLNNNRQSIPLTQG